MDSTELRRSTAPADLKALYAPVAEELAAVEELLGREFASENHFVDRLAQHGFRLGGKRLRPALVLLSAKACGRIGEEHKTLAVAAELIHTATLIHDDVLDEATLRRHIETVNARWDNEASILLGDYLMARAMCLVCSLEDNYASRVISQSARWMCEGELMQIESRGRYDLSEDEYQRIIAGKTAALTSCCCRLGAYYAGATAEVYEPLARYGHELGVAFQIADDLLDLVGEEAAVGKSLGTDLAKQKATLPIIRLLQTAAPAQRDELTALLARSDNHRRDVLRPWLQKSDALDYARQKARQFTARASDELDVIPPSSARDALRGLTHFVIDRRQ
jgi:octaprenyl-diphosphate synthase